MSPLHSLRSAPTFRPLGSHLLRIRISRETARALLKLTRDRTSRAALHQSLLDADLNEQMNATVGPIYAGAGTCVLLCDTRDRLLAELNTPVESLRAAGAM